MPNIPHFELAKIGHYAVAILTRRHRLTRRHSFRETRDKPVAIRHLHFR
jgi:hypothetical protein